MTLRIEFTINEKQASYSTYLFFLTLFGYNILDVLQILLSIFLYNFFSPKLKHFIRQ